jgi:hypothetical protein
MERNVLLILQWDETFDIGSDTGTPVENKVYQLSFKRTAKLNKLAMSIDRPKLTPEDEKELMEGAEKAADRR